MNLELYLTTSSSEREISRVVSRDFGVIIYHISPLPYCSWALQVFLFIYHTGTWVKCTLPMTYRWHTSETRGAFHSQKFRFEISEISQQPIFTCPVERYIFQFHRLLASRIEKSGTGGNNFVRWKKTFRSDDWNDQTSQSDLWTRIFSMKFGLSSQYKTRWPI